MERIKACAQLSIQRGVGFALLAIGVLLVGFSWNLRLALEIGSGSTLLLCVVLFFRGLAAPDRDYRKTETWILLDRKPPLPADRLQKAIGTILQDLYRRYAEWALIAAVAQWLGSVAMRLF